MRIFGAWQGRFGRRVSALAVAAVAAAGLGVLVAPSPASAEPAYYLYQTPQGVVGPCGSALSIGAYYGYATFSSPYFYQNTPTEVWWETPDDQVWEHDEQGFSSADVYKACSNYQYTYRYYGANKVHRTVTTRYHCIDDELSCLYWGTTYSAWTASWW
ncbi:hypothetical protein [Rugosimonospora africana]|uniref:Secreted protein n=1 Tax=Rugosimonospora africana TaxID=556532 RepID=A0A8J3QX49_9ACTN|nr:hypothetical protein [Rugosimonospora africana]GIH17423.1 hypothetical protein Raf01_55950 [Rugosimonospora africana]